MRGAASPGMQTTRDGPRMELYERPPSLNIIISLMQSCKSKVGRKAKGPNDGSYLLAFAVECREPPHVFEGLSGTVATAK